MTRPAQLTTLHLALAEVFFSLDATGDFLVAGGAGLLASNLIARPTEDLDLFASAPTTSVTAAKDAFTLALRERGFDVVLVQDSPMFCRLVVTRPPEEALVDLAIDAPPQSDPTTTILGPTLAPLELAGRKLLALFGRAEARDFADVYVLAQRFSADALVKQAQELDPGFDRNVLAQMIESLGRFDDDEIPLSDEQTSVARQFFAAWTRELR